MNVFALSAIASPLAGAIAGGASAKWSTLGIFMGLAIGLILYFTAMRFSDRMLRVPGVSTKTEGLSPLQWLASMAGVLVPGLSPFAAWALSTFIVARLLHS